MIPSLLQNDVRAECDVMLADHLRVLIGCRCCIAWLVNIHITHAARQHVACCVENATEIKLVLISALCEVRQCTACECALMAWHYQWRMQDCIDLGTVIKTYDTYSVLLVCWYCYKQVVLHSWDSVKIIATSSTNSVLYDFGPSL